VTLPCVGVSAGRRRSGTMLPMPSSESALSAGMPVLSGPHLRCRAFRDEDVAVVREVADDPLIPLITTVPTDSEGGAALAYVRRQQARVTEGVGYSFAIADATDDRALGQIGLWLRGLEHGRANIGYWVAPSARRRGVATEALGVLSAWGLSLPGVARVELYVEPWNVGSWKAAEAAGYQREGLLRSWQLVGGQRRDMFMYSRINAS